MSSTNDLSDIVAELQSVVNQKLKPSADLLERYVKLKEVIDLGNTKFLRSLQQFEEDNQTLVNQMVDALGMAKVEGETVVSRCRLTTQGALRLSVASPVSKITARRIQVGDGNGASYIITGAETALKRVVFEGVSSNPISDTNRPNILYFDVGIPATVGGFTIREVGLIDDFDQLFCVGVTTVLSKPDPAQDNGIVTHVRISLELPSINDVLKFNFQNPAFPHSVLGLRDVSDAHPLSSISGAKELRDELFQGVIYPTKPELAADIIGQNNIPVGTTHLRLNLSGGRTAIYAMQPPVSGQIISIKRYTNEPFAVVVEGNVEAILFNPMSKNATDLKNMAALSNVNKSLINVMNYFANSNQKMIPKQYLWEPTADVSEHDGVTAVAKAALQQWNGLASGLSGFMGWSGTGNGVFYNLSTFSKYKRVSDFIADGNDQTACNNGWKALSKVVQSGDVILVDGSFLAGQQGFELRINQKQGVMLTGGTIRKVAGAGEFPVWINECEDCMVNSVFFHGKDTVIPVWGSQGLYVRSSKRVIVNGCIFKDMGDGAIRYARNTSSNMEVAAFGIIIVNCVFKNCQQVTSNNTGASDVIFSNNIVDGHMTVKVTQRVNIVPGNTLIIGNVYKDADKYCEVQGGRNVYVMNNVGSAKQLLGAYPNANSYTGKHIIATDVAAINNRIELTSPDEGMIFYTEVRDNGDGTPIIQDGDITIRGNVFYTRERRTAYSIRLTHYTDLQSQCFQNLYIEDNEFQGEFRDLVTVGGDSGFELSKGEVIRVLGNKGGVFHTDWISIKSRIYNTGKRPKIYIQRNTDMDTHGTGLVTAFAYRDTPNGNQTIPEVFFFTDNDVIFRKGGIQWYDGARFAPAIKSVFTGNILHSKAGAEVNQLWLFAPEPNVQGFSTMVYKDNTHIIDEGVNIRPFYMNGTVSPAPNTKWKRLMVGNNNFSGGREPRCDNVGYRTSGLDFGLSNNNLDPIKLILSVYEANLNGVSGTWRWARIWSDGSCKIQGAWLNAASNSFNLYFGRTFETMLDLQITNLGNVGAPYVYARFGNYAVIRFNGGGNTWYSFTAEGLLGRVAIDSIRIQNMIY